MFTSLSSCRWGMGSMRMAGYLESFFSTKEATDHSEDSRIRGTMGSFTIVFDVLIVTIMLHLHFHFGEVSLRAWAHACQTITRRMFQSFLAGMV